MTNSTNPPLAKEQDSLPLNGDQLVDIENPSLTTRAVAWWKPPPFERIKQYADACAWQLTFPIDSEKDYAAVREYAERRYEEASQIVRDLDKKCEVLLALAGAIAGVVFGAVKAYGLEFTNAAGAGFGCFLLVILIMALTRRPVPNTPSADIKTVVETVNLCTEKRAIDAKVAGALHCASVGKEVVQWWKALQLQRATWIFSLGVVCLFYGLLTSTPEKSQTTNSDGFTPVSSREQENDAAHQGMPRLRERSQTTEQSKGG